MKAFVVVGVQRSGTTLITTSLDSHPRAHCVGELFKMRSSEGSVEVGDSGYRQYVQSRVRLKLTDKFLRRRLVTRFLDKFFEQREYDAVGFKLMSNQTRRDRFPMVIPYIVKRQIGVLHVVRENPLKTYVSRLTARHRRIFHATSELRELPRLEVPTIDLQMHLTRIETQNVALTRRFDGAVPYLRCSYERFVDEPAAEAKRMLSFLGLPFAPLKSPLVKVGVDDLGRVLKNLEEVRHALKGTPFERLIE